jgi:hypothetical protein
MYFNQVSWANTAFLKIVYNLRKFFNINVKMDFKILSQIAHLLSKIQTSTFMSMKQEARMLFINIGCCKHGRLLKWLFKETSYYCLNNISGL